mmetsp:Transcript_96573/g.223927  ORF Transcript_96573/g.223927 Transcript_96573/m.223927 type:complete len:544 (-) Transcript_96573:87-1718(-)|eukprot:CAMPEP_0171057940 /NCGR_PEP_ID=MMETSP0766_2-20121228/2137_1 /TAXON_ID=439317 /ORGANISM="Gambierdiscus australes, Strain CAWD 149" /LENGTH=543 /DNA_ID=CAMNT_0011513141 /DNA_START=73 /DNA_END=1704 /DNA_ORIENTATION=-
MAWAWMLFATVTWALTGSVPRVDDDVALIQRRAGVVHDELDEEEAFRAVFEDGSVTQIAQSAGTARAWRSWNSRVRVLETGMSQLLSEQHYDISTKAQQELEPVLRRLAALEASPDARSKRQVLVNYGDVQYVSHFRMGRQTIVGILDTGSFELVVFSRACKSCGSAAKYDPKMSPNHLQGKLMTMQSYGSGDTYSAQAYDMFAIGPYKETNQTFWEVVGARMPILMSSAFEAIVGIGPPETPAVDAWQDAQEALANVSAKYSEGIRPNKVLLKQAKESIDAALEVSRSPTMIDNFNVGSFSLCLGATPGSDGYLVWNDSSAFDTPQLFQRVQVVGKHTWSVKLDNVQLAMGGVSTEPFACNEGCVALMDSGTSLLAVPTSAINRISREMTQLNADCSNIHELPDLVFYLGGHRFSLPPDAYVAEVSGAVPKYLQSLVRTTQLKSETRQCQLLLMESYAEGEHGPFWILGMPFFRKYYTTFFVGENADSRALYVAPASEDCMPTPEAEASASRSRAYRRRIDPNKVHVPNAVQKAHSQRKIAL